jgi:hypothetical protein
MMTGGFGISGVDPSRPAAHSTNEWTNVHLACTKELSQTLSVGAEESREAELANCNN